MASSWGGSWASSWLNSWGPVGAVTETVTGRRRRRYQTPIYTEEQLEPILPAEAKEAPDYRDGGLPALKAQAALHGAEKIMREITRLEAQLSALALGAESAKAKTLLKRIAKVERQLQELDDEEALLTTFH